MARRALLPTITLIILLAASCTTSNVAWDEEQYSKSRSMNQILKSLTFPRDRASVLSVLGSPVIRIDQNIQIESVVSAQQIDDLSDEAVSTLDSVPPARRAELKSALTEAIRKQQVNYEIFVYQTGPKEMTRLFAIDGTFIVADPLATVDQIYAEQGTWVQNQADSIRVGVDHSIVTSYFGKESTSQGIPDRPGVTAYGYQKANLISWVAAESNGMVTNVSTIRWDSTRQAYGRPDVLMANLAVVATAEVPQDRFEAAIDSLIPDEAPGAASERAKVLRYIVGQKGADLVSAALKAAERGDVDAALGKLRRE